MVREEIVVRKLTADGDGTGEERRIQHVLMALRGALHVKPNRTEAIKALRFLDQLELNGIKQRGVTETCKRQAEDYQRMAAEIDEEIARAQERMAAAKEELAEARQVRRNRQEYDLLARMIESVPSRAATKKKLEDLADELNAQQERQKVLEAKLAERRNHLHAFNIILANFQKFLADEERMDSEEFAGGESEEKEKKGPEANSTSASAAATPARTEKKSPQLPDEGEIMAD